MLDSHNPYLHHQYDDVYKKIIDFNNGAEENIVQSSVIDKSKKTDDPTCENLVEMVTLEITHECSNTEFLNHKEALSHLFCHFEFALKFNHLQRSTNYVFFHWIGSVSWGISSVGELPIFLTELWESIYLRRMIKNRPQLVDMIFMQVMIFLNPHFQMTFQISNTT